jgi:hypothetical protein
MSNRKKRVVNRGRKALKKKNKRDKRPRRKDRKSKARQLLLKKSCLHQANPRKI